MNRNPICTLTLAAIAGLALSAGAQDAVAPAQKTKVSSSTTIMKSSGDESYEVRIEDGKITSFRLNGEPVEPSRYKLDEEGGFIVLMQEDAEPVIIDIPKFDTREFRFAARGMPGLPGAPDAPEAPGAIQWLDAPGVPDAPAAFAWSGGEPPRVMIGITHDDVSAELREKLSLAEGEGVYVIEVREGLPAAKAGLQPGDVIIEVDGQRLEKRNVLMNILKEREPGDELKIIVLRDGERQKLKLGLEPYDAGRLGAPAPEFPARFEFRELDDLEGLDGMEFFGDFDFDFDMEDLPPEAREEVKRALQKARESAREARNRAFRLHIEADDQQRGAARQELELRSFAEGHRAAREIAEKLREMELDHKDRLLRVGPEGRAFIIQRGEIQDGREFDDSEDVRRERDNLNKSVHTLIQKLAAAQSTDERQAIMDELIATSKEARTLHSEFEPMRRARDEQLRAQGQTQGQGEEGVLRLRAERDTLEARNRELEGRVEELERKLTELMARMDENQPRPRSR